MACALSSPNRASVRPAKPRPNDFSAARRVTDWARLFVSSSNLLLILFLPFRCVCGFVFLNLFRETSLVRRPRAVTMVRREIHQEHASRFLIRYGDRIALRTNRPTDGRRIAK